jgi:hypothetical protein
MNLLRFFTAALMSLSLVGCCCNRCLVSDPCDPCGAIPARGGCALSRWWNSHRGYGWESPCGCTCGSCGCGGGGEMMDPYSYGDSGSCAGSCAAPVMSGPPASGGCNCGQSAQYSAMPSMSGPTYMNSSPTFNPQPSSTPQPIPEVPPSSPNYAPAPPATNTAEPQTMIPSGNGQPHMVSYEEFQRLPGKVVSGPEPTANVNIPAPIQQVSTSSPSFVVPPAPAPSPARGPSRFVKPGPNQQAVWTPSRAN